MKATLSKYLFLHIIFTFIKKLLLEAAEIIPLHLKKNFGFLEKLHSEITGYEKNQINSSYELLWQEYKNPNTDGALICNTMRRILEHYFNVIGHKDYDKIIDQFIYKIFIVD